MKIRYIYILALLALLLSIPPDLFSDETPGTANSRPNASGGFDFYDSEGTKLGFSSKDNNGNYVYYNANGSVTGSIKYDGKTGRYNVLDGDNIRVGELNQDRHGGYRFSNTKEAAQTPLQMNIRRDYSYSNPYGEGIETFSMGVITGVVRSPRSGANVGLDTSAQGAGLGLAPAQLTGKNRNILETRPRTDSKLSTKGR